MFSFRFISSRVAAPLLGHEEDTVAPPQARRHALAVAPFPQRHAVR